MTSNTSEVLWIKKEKTYSNEQQIIIDTIVDRLKIDTEIAQVLAERNNFDINEIKYFLDSNPKPLSPYDLKDIQLAVDIIKDSMSKNEKIRIVGDYDIDGTTSTNILLLMFEAFSYPYVDFYLPLREKDGYGLNTDIVNNAYNDNVKLIITVDNGISAVEAITLAKSLNMKVVVTDHHEIPNILPPADAIVNPHQLDCNYPYKILAGGGVAYKLSQAMILDSSTSKDIVDKFLNENYSKKIISLAALATICDVAKLIGENRAIVKHGLKYLNENSIPSIRCISENMTVGTLGFQVGPRLNACGRLQDAKTALDFLRSSDFEEYSALKIILDNLNDTRKKEEQNSIQRVMANVSNYSNLPDIIVEIDDEAHESIVGLCAGKIKEHFYRPTIVFTKTINGTYKGSGRSIEEYNMFENIKPYMHLISGGGGHPMACGLKADTKEQIYLLRDALNNASTLSDYDKTHKLFIDKFIGFNDDLYSLYHQLQLLEPCGTGNPSLTLAMKDVYLEIKYIPFKNKKGEFGRIKVYNAPNKSICIEGICWNDSLLYLNNNNDKKITSLINADIVIKLEYSDFNQQIELNIQDIKYRL